MSDCSCHDHGEAPAAAAAASETEQSVPAERLDAESAQPFAAQGERVPTKDTQLRKWAAIPYGKYRELADLALEEKWYYGDDDEQARERLPILRNYLEYTFRRLSFENKVKIGTDLWSAVSDEPIEVGTEVIVDSSEGVHVHVRRI